MNIYLDYFDKKMMSKKIRIVRYADDILIFAKSKSEAGKYGAIATNILENELKLKVNKVKTHITNRHEGVAFLEFIIKAKYVTIHPKRIRRFKDKLRWLTPRNHGMNVSQMVNEINPIIATALHMALPNIWFRELGLVDTSKIQVGILSHYYE